MIKVNKTKEKLSEIYSDFIGKIESKRDLGAYLNSVRFKLKRQVMNYTNELVDNDFDKYNLL